MEEFQDQFQEMQKELRALKGKDLFGKNTHDLCLVPNVKIPAKFKVLKDIRVIRVLEVI